MMLSCNCFKIATFAVWCLVLVDFLNSEGICPKKINEFTGDYGAKARFDKVRASNNEFTLTHSHNRKDPKSRDIIKETYTYTMKFCGDKKTDDAVLQKEVEKDHKTPDIKSIGTFENATLVGGENWLFLMYYNGARYHSHCNKAERETWIMINCEDQGEDPVMRLIEESRFKNGEKDAEYKCYYLFKYNHPEACNKHPEACNKKPKKLSGGAIFIIVLVSLFGAYFLFGFLYQRFVVKAKGFDQIPNAACWRKVGNMSADGCDFVCRREERPNTYKGMADALDIESSDDEDKDDGLLPM